MLAVIKIVEGLDGGEGCGGGISGSEDEGGVASRKNGDFGGFEGVAGFPPHGGVVAEVHDAPEHHEVVGLAGGVEETGEAGKQGEVGGGPEGDGLALGLWPELDERPRRRIVGMIDGGADEEERQAGVLLAESGDALPDSGVGGIDRRRGCGPAGLDRT